MDKQLQKDIQTSSEEAFRLWWETEGWALADHSEETKRDIAYLAWSNGTYKAIELINNFQQRSSGVDGDTLIPQK